MNIHVTQPGVGLLKQLGTSPGCNISDYYPIIPFSLRLQFMWKSRSNIIYMYSIFRWLLSLGSKTGPCFTTATWRCRKNFSQWECSFHWKLCCHWLEFWRRDSSDGSWYALPCFRIIQYNLNITFTFGQVSEHLICHIRMIPSYDRSIYRITTVLLWEVSVTLMLLWLHRELLYIYVSHWAQGYTQTDTILCKRFCVCS